MKKYLSLLAFASLLPMTAHADSFKSGKFYASLGGGVTIPQNTDINWTGAVTGSGTAKYKTGYSVDGIVGYHFTDFLAAEGDIQYTHAKFDKISASLTGGALGVGNGDIGVDGNVSAFIGLINGIITPVNFLGVSPYIGGGIGVARAKSSISSETFNGATVAVDSSDSETDFAADGLAGFDVSVAPGFSLGGRYQYLWVDSKSTNTDGGITEKDGNFGAHVITARAVFKF